MRGRKEVRGLDESTNTSFVSLKQKKHEKLMIRLSVHAQDTKTLKWRLTLTEMLFYRFNMATTLE